MEFKLQILFKISTIKIIKFSNFTNACKKISKNPSDKQESRKAALIKLDVKATSERNLTVVNNKLKRIFICLLLF